MKSNLFKNTLLLSFGTILVKGINLIMVPLFSSWLSTEDYGTFDLFSTYVSLLVPFITLSASEAIFRFAVDETDEKERKEYTTCGFIIYALGLSLAVIFLLIANFIFGWIYAIPFLFLLVGEICNNCFQAFLRAEKKLYLYSISSVITTIGIAVGVSILVLQCHMGLNGMIYGYSLGYFAGVTFMIFSGKCWKMISFKLAEKNIFKTLIGYSWPLIPNSISWWIINVSDRTFINIYLGAAANGIYAIAYKIPNFCASLLSVFYISWQETAIDSIGSENQHSYLNRVFNRLLWTTLSLCGGLLALNYFLFKYIFDNRYFDGRLYAPILVTSLIFTALIQFFGGIQISLKHSKANGITTVVGAIVNVIIDLALLPFIGIYAAAFSTLVANIVIAIVRYIMLHEQISIRLEKRTFFLIVFYAYLLIMSYDFSSLTLACINLAVSIIVGIIANREYIFDTIKKYKKNKSKG